jgi:hypothetical protein
LPASYLATAGSLNRSRLSIGNFIFSPPSAEMEEERDGRTKCLLRRVLSGTLYDNRFRSWNGGENE